ncbi:MAG: CopG family transcriptional regulator [Chloroflexi bacterium]|nr:CopG family transcriptional regulator [Chloroflexota bacterium]
MKRTQIYLDAAVDAELRRLAARRGVSKAQLIRDCARILVEEDKATQDPLLNIVGMISGGPDNLSEEHDRYLAGREISSWEK